MKVIQLLLVLLLLLLWIATWTKRKEEAINKQAAAAPNKHILFTCWTNGSCGVQGGRSTSIRCVVCMHNRHHKFPACTTYYAHTGASASASAGNHSLFHRIKSQFWIFVFTFQSNENACIFLGHTVGLRIHHTKESDFAAQKRLCSLPFSDTWNAIFDMRIKVKIK